MRRAFGWFAAIVLLGAVVAGGVYGITRLVEEQEEEEPVEKPELVTRAIERGDLVDTETFTGSLRYQNPGTFYLASGGLVTWLPEPGDVVGRGERLAELDGAPVVLMFGERPAWRALFDGVEDGTDVEQLEENLVELGYDPDGELTVDEEFSDVTAQAVEEWQADLGIEESGILDLGRVIFEEGPVRVGRLLTAVGATVGPGVPLFEVSGTDREVVVPLDVDRRDLVEVGEEAVIVLPDDVEAAAVISSIANVATVDPQTGMQTLEMTLEFVDPAQAEAFEQAVVDVEVVSEQVLDALLVPVEAVLALAEGGYAIEVVEGDTTRLVGVELGKFADGMVEVTGDIGEGDTIAVPR